MTVQTGLTRGLALCMALFAWLPNAVAEEVAASEYDVKAAIIYKIAKFVSWPPDTSSGPKQLSICLEAQDPIAPAMDNLSGRVVQGRSIEIHRLNETTAQTLDCEILFLSGTSNDQITARVTDVSNLPVLTIGEGADFVANGGIISLQIQQSRIQFAVNVEASQRAGLGISAQLLQLANVQDRR